ncbi:MAG TPA: hypothetical protein PK147_10355 [Saprospiraceae bacterium]|nr:hypothetical protein [Saprospiraceae bacterium]
MAKMPVLSVFALIICLSNACKTPTPAVEEVVQNEKHYDLSLKVRDLEPDKLNNLYIITESNKIQNFDTNLELKYEFSNKRYGNLTNLDLRDPLRILVFIDDFDQLLFLDNTLSLIGELRLSDLGYTDVTAACRSNDDKIWIFDRAMRKLIKIDELGNKILESSVFEDYGVENAAPFKMIEAENSLVLADKNQGILLFDNLGQYSKKFQITNAVDLQFNGKVLYTYDGKSLKMVKLNFAIPTTIGFPIEFRIGNLQNIKLTPEKWYGIYPEGVERMSRN